ncbi:MAG: pantoate--beta-alanine ligase [Bacteroidota bacterium]
MQILTTLPDLQHWQTQNRAQSIGFVPTMGALHEGHLSLVEASSAKDDATIVSIFVNPTQFNDKSDLEKYPRTLEADLAMLDTKNVDAVFAPPEDVIYPSEGFKVPDFELTDLTNVLEGAYRPGHFDGVVQVVYRLLDLVRPDRLYMGLKDYQQQAIIAAMLRQSDFAIQLIPVSIVREEDGLAMSSRNRRLTPEQRLIAPTIYQTLQQAQADWIAQFLPTSIQAKAISTLEQAGFQVDYFEIVEATTLESVELFDESVDAIACVAAYIGDIRLIDNLQF